MEIELTREEIIRLFASGDLLRTIAERRRPDLTPDLSKTEALCVELHNEGTIDLLALTSPEQLGAFEKSSFFGAVLAIRRLIPHLTSDATAMMQSVERLVAPAGQDLAANLPNGELIEWFARHPDEAQSVVICARQGEPLSIRHAAFALQALRVPEQARSMAHDYVDERRLAAITALARMEDVDPVGYAKSCTLFGELLEPANDDALQAHILAAASWIFDKCDLAQKSVAADVIRRAASGGGTNTRWSAASSLQRHRALVQSTALHPLIDLLSGTAAEELSTVEMIDGATHALVHAGKIQEAVQLVTTLIVDSAGGLTLERFPCFVSVISTSSEALARTILTCLVSGEPSLCRCLSELFHHSNEFSGPVITAPPDALPITDGDCIFVARKAVGWLILKPVTAASILVALMRACGEAATDAIADLLARMLLANYGSVHTYLVTLREDQALGQRIAGMVAANAAYLQGLQSVPDLPELRPSEFQLRVQHERQTLRARETGKAARKQSVFLSMVKHSRILHGAGTLTTVFGLGGAKQRVDTPFHTTGFSIELPRLESADPIGFDMALMTCRMERRTP